MEANLSDDTMHSPAGETAVLQQQYDMTAGGDLIANGKSDWEATDGAQSDDLIPNTHANIGNSSN